MNRRYLRGWEVFAKRTKVFVVYHAMTRYRFVAHQFATLSSSNEGTESEHGVYVSYPDCSLARFLGCGKRLQFEILRSHWRRVPGPNCVRLLVSRFERSGEKRRASDCLTYCCRLLYCLTSVVCCSPLAEGTSPSLVSSALRCIFAKVRSPDRCT